MKNLKLKAARAAMGLSQQGLADLCRQICRVLGTTLDELFWEDEPNI